MQASQGGIDAALAGIRAANNGSGTGVNTSLAVLGDRQGQHRKHAELHDHHLLLQLGKRSDHAPVRRHLACGTRPDLHTSDPAFRLSAGNAATGAVVRGDRFRGDRSRAGSNAQYGNRELRTVYNFVISNVNVAGGPILVFPTASNLCLDGATYPGGTVVKAGNQLSVRTCVVNAAWPAVLVHSKPDFADHRHYRRHPAVR